MQNKFEYTWNNWQRRITADKKKIKNFPKLPSATSFIRRALGDIL